MRGPVDACAILRVGDDPLGTTMSHQRVGRYPSKWWTRPPPDQGEAQCLSDDGAAFE
jgi:hypothetical protein